MTTQELQRQILKSLNDPAMPISVRLADYPTQETMARILAERLQPPQTPPPSQRRHFTYAAMSADKYD